MAYLNSKQVVVATSDTLVSAMRTRNYLGIQNQDAANFVVIKFNGSSSLGDVATATNGIKLLAGEFYQIPIAVVNSEIRAIADTGSVNIVINEGA